MTTSNERDEISRHIVTDEQQQRLHDARRTGDLCAGCGRDLTVDEPVWQEGFTRPGMGAAMYLAPVGVECVSPSFLALTRDVEPERCAGCGRGVHYLPDAPQPGRARIRAVCSRRCGTRATVANQRKHTESEG
jgi:hypothetical protein